MRYAAWIAATVVAAGGVYWIESYCGESAMAQEAKESAACCAADTAVSEAPVACTITDADVLKERIALTEQLFGAAQKTVETENGYRLKFDRELAPEVFDYAQFESDCCAFVEFTITFEPNHGAVWLGLFASPDANPVLDEMFGSRLAQ